MQNHKVHICCNSFFAKSKLTLHKWFILMVWWAKQYPVCEDANEAEVTEKTLCQVYQWLQEVCSTTLLQTPIVLGGPGVIVQVDESQFRHKPKVQDRNILQLYRVNTGGSQEIHMYVCPTR